jgi:hypothetical protein
MPVHASPRGAPAILDAGRETLMLVPFSEQELSDFIFDRIMVHCPKCPDVECIRAACVKVAGDLLERAEIVYREEPISDGGA